jgi:hypothetical protein
VTRLGDFSPIGWLFTLGSFFENKKIAKFFGLPFSTVIVCINLDKQSVGLYFGRFYLANSSGRLIWTAWEKLRSILNFAPRGKLSTQVRSWLPGVNFAVPNSRECSPLGVNEGVNITSMRRISPLGARGEVKNGTQSPWWQAGTIPLDHAAKAKMINSFTYLDFDRIHIKKYRIFFLLPCALARWFEPTMILLY